jgi:hypothetical protein
VNEERARVLGHEAGYENVDNDLAERGVEALRYLAGNGAGVHATEWNDVELAERGEAEYSGGVPVLEEWYEDAVKATVEDDEVAVEELEWQRLDLENAWRRGFVEGGLERLSEVKL